MASSLAIYLFVVAMVALVGISRRATSAAARLRLKTQSRPQSRPVPKERVVSQRNPEPAGPASPGPEFHAPEPQVHAPDPPRARTHLAAGYKPAGTRSFAARVEEIMSDAQRFFGLNGVSEEEKETLTAHQRRYYDHYNAASSQLARGNIKAFKDELKRAGRELSEMEVILSNHWQELRGQALGRILAFDSN
ncbi:MAG TPA: hypothetical protein VGB25_09105 [Candidatus Binatia bacterium]